MSVVLALVGATATGKSAAALALAQRHDLEVINADAMQLYRGMDIGTAKTPPAQRAGVPHHLLDILEVTQEAAVADYQVLARRCIAEVIARGRTPVLVGGSGLYLRATLDHLEFPATDPAVRARWEERGEREGPGMLHAELERLDPASAERIGSRNTRRLVRALEVIELTGRPYSATLPTYTYADLGVDAVVQVGLRVPREQLLERIASRAEAMFDSGLLAETEHLRELGLERGVTASRAVGYAQALAVLDGRLTRAEGIEQTSIATRQVARRQVSWFGRDPRITWLEGTAGLDAQVAGIERAVGWTS
ncbi:tRNA (adenosine(37)-N6)-dimethylallyltransferase MiaA [Serinibacter salmoneus]|uniref:tRNA (adenosine(37)-N6)-dimethylallyltransferase MiaA n=1 Tax=Serinibacter salmoneus TaxID=556530 RepID=UPI001FE755B8|nr:tRNA (adenosine(37)-N6)-dimethylallyltransferase MiaA [Serinibacter salmoneus]